MCTQRLIIIRRETDEEEWNGESLKAYKSVDTHTNLIITELSLR